MAVAVRTKEYRLTQWHASDREVLQILSEAVDSDGYAESAAVAAVYWPRAMSKADSVEAVQATQAVARRLSHMARELRIVSKEKKAGLARWRITNEGQALLSGRLRAAVEKGLSDIDASGAVLAMQTLSMHAKSRTPTGQMVTRAFRFSSGRR